jgi:hypothetical protein
MVCEGQKHGTGDLEMRIWTVIPRWAHIKKCAPFVPASLTPCFSWVFSAPFVFNRFSGFRASLNR